MAPKVCVHDPMLTPGRSHGFCLCKFSKNPKPVSRLLLLHSSQRLQVYKSWWWMKRFGSPTPKRHLGYSSCRTVEKLYQGYLARAGQPKHKNKKGGSKVSTTRRYKDRAGKVRYSGTSYLKKSQYQPELLVQPTQGLLCFLLGPLFLCLSLLSCFCPSSLYLVSLKHQLYIGFYLEIWKYLPTIALSLSLSLYQVSSCAFAFYC